MRRVTTNTIDGSILTSLDFFGMSADSVKNPSDIAICYANNDSVLYDSMISHKRKTIQGQ